MSSPGARQRRRRQQYQTPRSRREVLIAIGAGVAIVSVTALIIWLFRPGGLADRQPRSSWLVGFVIGAVALSAYVVLRPTSRLKMSPRASLSIALGVIAVITLVAGFRWPGGLVRHTPTFATLPPTPATTASPATTAPKSGGASTTTSKSNAPTSGP
jgi:hypothetical protein